MAGYNQILEQARQLLMRGKIAEAEPLYREVLKLRPRNVDALIGLALAYNATMKYAEAVELFKQALALQPYSLPALVNLGAAYHAMGRFAEAVEAFEQSVKLQQRNATVWYNLGTSLKAVGRLEEAVGAFRKGVEIKPDYSEAFFNLGNTLREQQKQDEAIEAYQRALKLNPQYAEACNNMGHAYKNKGEIDEAVGWFRKAMVMKPGFRDPVGALAGALRDLGQVEDSLAPFRHHLGSGADDSVSHSGYLLALEYLVGQDPGVVFEEYRRWGKRYADAGKFEEPVFGNGKNPERRLRVGYLSGDFRQHAVAFFIENLLAFHDRSQVEIFGYNTNTYSDAVTERFKGYAQQWRDVGRMSDAEVVEAIRGDGVDILVDLAGHTAANRLLAVAQRVAPVQVSYLGYIATTGLSQVDYRMADGFTDPVGMTEGIYTEKLVRLPRTFAVYRPWDGTPEVSEAPAVRNGFVTFGALSVAAKVNGPVVRTWAGILKRVAGSRMIIGGNGMTNRSVQERVAGIFAEEGVERGRLDFYGSQPLKDYFALHGRMDLMLDPFPITGHTITCNALWMGVPVVSLAGKKYVSRLGVSVLSNLKLTELVGQSVEEYAAIAVGLAGDVGRLEGLRAGMRERMRGSPIMDYAGFARDVEGAYRGMWREWCSR